MHYPLTANRPAISSNIALEDRPTGADRLWVVNQDNDSVSVFNTKYRRPPDTAQCRHRAAFARHLAERRGLGHEQAVVDDQRHRCRRRGPSSARSRCRPARSPSASSPPRRAARCTSRSRRTGRLLKIDAASDATLASLDCRPQPASRLGDRRRQPRLCFALHHAAAAGREHGDRADADRRPASRRRSRRREWTGDDDGRDDRAASQRQAGLREPGPRHSELPRRRRDLAGRPLGLGSVEAGQRQARHAPRYAEPQLPEHRARDQLAHRPAGRRRGLRGTHRSRQCRRRERGTPRPERRLHVRRAGDEPPGRDRRRL